jgi:GNS1/SUR4 family
MLIKAGSVGYVFAIMNCAVHTLMYFYYFLTSLRFRPTWGRYLTLMQLSQMVVGIAVPFVWSFYHYSGYACPCQDIPAFFISSVIIYGSYFVLFLCFYLQRWGNGQQSKDTSGKSKSKKSKSKKIE